MKTKKYAIFFKSVKKDINLKKVLKNITFPIVKGKTTVLLGQSGTGKSTLLKILAKLQMPEQGEVIFSRGLRIGYVAQENEFCDQPLTEVLKEAKKKENYLSAEEEEAHIHAILSRLGFKDLDVSAQLLSGGWKKRLAIACELVNSPDLLFLDEPTNHLDLEGVIWLETFLALIFYGFHNFLVLLLKICNNFTTIINTTFVISSHQF
mgnify:CR=1 FL=1